MRVVNLGGHESSNSNQFQCQLTEEQKNTIEIARQNISGIHIIVDTIPEEDLEPGPPSIGTYKLIPNSYAWNLCRYISQNYGLICSTVQKNGANSFDDTGKRTAKNHSLVIIIP